MRNPGLFWPEGILKRAFQEQEDLRRHGSGYHGGRKKF
jgi:hypothetical protein